MLLVPFGYSILSKLDRRYSATGTITRRATYLHSLIALACLLLVSGCSRDEEDSFTSASGGGGGSASLQSCGDTGIACTADEYCAFASNCGVLETTASCLQRPTDCNAAQEPVCGCDHVNYGNACLAQQAGTDVFYEGECGGALAPSCGFAGIEFPNGATLTLDYCMNNHWTCSEGSLEFTDFPCANPTFCDSETYNACGVDCLLVPSECTNVESPVCGCDGMSYQNACLAALARVGVASEGDCP